MNVHRTQLKGFTLIELMIATTLGLMLLGGLVQIVAMVNTSFSDTRVLIDLQNRCRSTQMLLQNDLSHISVNPQPPRPTQADDGYLSLGVSNLTFADGNKTSRGGIVLVDADILNDGKHHYAAFTVFNRENPFTFTDPNDTTRTLQTPYAEVVWFVYKYDLYRVVVPFVNSPETARNYPNSGWPSVRMISPALLGVPTKRIMNTINSYINNNQIRQFMVLPNVCNFCVQVYNPIDKDYNEIPSMGTYFKGSGGSVQSKTISSFTAYYDTGSYLSETSSTGSATQDNTYVNPNIYKRTDLSTTTAFLPGLRIIVRSFDPDSGTIRQFRVGQDFRTR
ncbi:MAG: prepilin-type N-terminal cleavage/methylation domain-containing protein [Thermoguttaceae bacterium]|nr:prepilin-type N-terminal cleavage/methylation domain-containing protein [Thermoguttaceae bacterium]MBR0191744.1 prepilin-type N-terminal cleavage/methylation domain-containing protein [Thermoguttaceae bacterium]